MKYVWQRVPSEHLESRVYEIGVCDNPRSSPDLWCDRRLCEGFWGRADLAEKTCDNLNLAASTEKPMVEDPDGKFGNNWIASLPSDMLALAALVGIIRHNTGVHKEIVFRLDLWKEQWEKMVRQGQTKP